MDGNDLFGFILIAGIVVLIAWVNNKVEEDAKRARGQLVGPKQCPPHKWKWHDQAGGGHFIQCETCRRFPMLSTRDDK
jgi:hypothetical protein